MGDVMGWRLPLAIVHDIAGGPGETIYIISYPMAKDPGKMWRVREKDLPMAVEGWTVGEPIDDPAR